MHKLADITGMESVDLPAVQAKISAGGEMYNAIQHFTSAYQAYREFEFDLTEERSQRDRRAAVRRAYRGLKAAAEYWANPVTESAHRE